MTKFQINIEIVDERTGNIVWKGKVSDVVDISDDRQKIKYYVDSESNYFWVLDYIKEHGGTGAST